MNGIECADDSGKGLAGPLENPFSYGVDSECFVNSQYVTNQRGDLKEGKLMRQSKQVDGSQRHDAQ